MVIFSKKNNHIFLFLGALMTLVIYVFTHYDFFFKLALLLSYFSVIAIILDNCEK